MHAGASLLHGFHCFHFHCSHCGLPELPTLDLILWLETLPWCETYVIIFSKNVNFNKHINTGIAILLTTRWAFCVHYMLNGIVSKIGMLICNAFPSTSQFKAESSKMWYLFENLNFNKHINTSIAILLTTRWASGVHLYAQWHRQQNNNAYNMALQRIPSNISIQNWIFKKWLPPLYKTKSYMFNGDNHIVWKNMHPKPRNPERKTKNTSSLLLVLV